MVSSKPGSMHGAEMASGEYIQHLELPKLGRDHFRVAMEVLVVRKTVGIGDTASASRIMARHIQNPTLTLS
jgi:hypothetical protein